MEEIKYTEFGITTTIKEYKSVGSELIGMRSGKPFVENGKIFINHEKQKYEVTEVEFHDENGNKISKDEVQLDTTTYAIGVFIRNKDVLIIKRVRPNLTYHVFPGGHIREGEEVEEALVREMGEEVGVDISNYKYEKVTEHHKENFGPEKVFFIYTEGDSFEFNEAEPDDVDSTLFWHSIDKISELDNVFQVEIVEKLNDYLKSYNNA